MLAVAWRNLWRQGRRTWLTASAMAVGMALCMGMIAMTDGMYVQMVDVLVGQNLGHVQVHHPDYPGKKSMYDTIHDVDPLLANMDEQPHMESATARLFAHGLAVGGGSSGGAAEDESAVGARLMGVHPEREHAVTHIGDRISEGRFIESGGQSEAVIGVKLADTLSIGVGDEILVMTQAADGSLANDFWTVVGIAKTGSSGLDRSGIWVDLPDLQAFLALDGQAHEIVAIADDAEFSGSLAEAVALISAAADLLVRPWFEADPDTAKMLAMQDASAFMLLGIVFSVAALGILNTMLMAVFERTRELGVLKALGLKPTRLMSLVILESLFLAAVANVLGLLLGGLFDYYIVTQGVDFSTSSGEGLAYEGVILNPVIYGVVRVWPIGLAVVSVFFVSALAAVWPAFRAARLSPIEAMRQT